MAKRAGQDGEGPGGASGAPAAEPLLRALLDSAPQGLALLDRELRYVEINATLARFNGRPAGDHLGRRMAEVLPDLSPDLLELCHGALRDGRPREWSASSGEDRAPAIWVTAITPLTGPDGAVSHLALGVREIGELVRAEQALRDSELHFRHLTEHAHDLISSHAPDGTCLYASPSFGREVGYAPQEMVGTPAYGFFHPDDVGVVAAAHQALLDGAQPPPVTYRFRHRDGHYLWLETVSSALRGAAGRVTRINTISRNVTERVQAEARRERLAGLTGALSATLTRPQVVAVVLEQLLPSAGAQAGAALLVEAGADGPAHLSSIGHQGYPASSAGVWSRFPLSTQAPIADAVRQGQPVYLEGDALERQYPQVAAAREHLGLAVAALPLLWGGAALGGLVLNYPDDHRFSAPERDWLLAVAGQLAQALERARLLEASALAEREARSSAAQLRAVLQQAPIGVALLDPQLRFTQINPPLARISGLPAEQHLGRTVQAAAPQTWPYARPHLEHLLAGGEAVLDVPVDLRGRGGRPGGRAYLTSYFPVRAPAGELDGIGVLAQDVTGLHRAERAARSSEAALQRALEASQVAVWDWDLTRREVTLDGQHAGLFGLPPGPQRLPEERLLERVWPEDRAALRRRLEAVAQAGGAFEHEFRVRWPGDAPAAPRTVQARGRCLASGLAARVGGIFQDVTGPRQAESERQKLSSIVEETSDFVGIADGQDRIVYLNPAALSLLGLAGLPPDLRVPDVIHLGDQAALPERRETVMHGGKMGGDLQFRHQISGVAIPMSVNSFGLRDPASGDTLGLAVVARDIRERLAHEQAMSRLNETLEARVEERAAQLADLNAELTAYASALSRDLQAPLRRLRGFLHLLERRAGAALDDKARGYVAFIHADAERVAQYADDLTGLSRFTQRELRPQPVALTPLAVQVRSDLEPSQQGRQGRVEWQIGELPVVRGDMLLLRQVLGALLHNALKFSAGREQARIEISASLTGQRGQREHVIAVRDNGVGFAPQDAGRLFRLFSRLHGDAYAGAGLGLVNVRRVMARHGGRVWAEGREDEGATFYLAFPADEGQGAGPEL